MDTGAKFSAITEKEVTIMGLNCPSLPYAKGEAIGFGGLFKNRMINRRVVLTFKSGGAEYKIKCGSFLVVCVPPNAKGDVREKIIRYTPSVLGMDILSRFRTSVDKNHVELTLVEK